MGVICVKKTEKQDLQQSRKVPIQKSNTNTIQTKMDKDEYKRLQIIRQFLTQDSKQSQKLIKQSQNQRQIGDFKFIRHLGDGSYGQVLMVKDNKSGQFYAMKIIRKQLIIQRDQILNALSERYILAAMDHPFVVKLHYAFQTKNKIHLIVDLMAGGQLFFLLRKNKKFQEQTAKFYAAQILLALQYLHTKKIIYRDLKPQNILLDRQGHIKLTDFGLSKVCLKRNQVATSVCGTPQYIAPEVLKGKGYTLAADWFSFGSLLYDMLTGKPPFYSKDKQQMMLKVQTKQIPFPNFLSQQAKSLLRSLFQKNQHNRLGFKKDAQEIKNHPFFKSINFQDVFNRKIKPPFSFEDNINAEGFAVKFDEFQLEESYEKQIDQKSKGINFQGFTYQVKGLKHPESKIQFNQLDPSKDPLSKQLQQRQDQEMNVLVLPEQNQFQQKSIHKQKVQDENKDINENSIKNKRSTFSISMHEAQKRNLQNSAKKQKCANVQQEQKVVIVDRYSLNKMQSSSNSQNQSVKKKSFQKNLNQQITTQQTINR